MNEMVKFGLIDNGLLCIITLVAIINAGRIRMPWSKGESVSTTSAALVGAMVGNTLSDAAAGLGIGMEATIGVTIGCLIPMIGFPLYRMVIARAERINA
jgi:hypothetical protein